MDTVQIALGLATIAMSGVTSGFVTFQLNARRDARQHRRQKLEQVYQSFHSFTLDLTKYWIPYLAVMTNSIKYNDALDMTIENTKNEAKPLVELEMLVAIYFPNLQKHIDELLHIRDKANEIISDHKEVYRNNGPHQSSAFAAMENISNELTALENRFRNAIRNEADKINRQLPGAA